MKSYDTFFVYSQFQKELKKILIELDADEEKIYDDINAHQLFFTAEQRMKQIENRIYNRDQVHYLSPNVSVGAFTYGTPIIRIFRSEEQVFIGKFCSIADNVSIFGGGEHRTDWGTTYPFNVIFRDFPDIKKHPASKGKVVIGNDVPPYAIIGGNPAAFLYKACMT